MKELKEGIIKERKEIFDEMSNIIKEANQRIIEIN